MKSPLVAFPWRETAAEENSVPPAQVRAVSVAVFLLLLLLLAEVLSGVLLLPCHWGWLVRVHRQTLGSQMLLLPLLLLLFPPLLWAAPGRARARRWLGSAPTAAR